MSKQVFEGSSYTTGSADLVTKTIDAQNTWSDEYVNPGPDGSVMVVPYTIAGGSTSTVTIQVARPGVDTWYDAGDTAGGVNGVQISPTYGRFQLDGGWRARIGVKTGHLGAAATVVVSLGTRAA